ncbi:TlyA family RNA methyltransferase [Cytobacillus sp. IB215316]|uniref:TlyA family RNA methyltransferase n=1 Tax=Cytobacillus sp. IB215316 TaxID=3097354 RepID=UPI002A0E7B52|nr:TlyA family RNA methyltransferase [Cytobacillus sp. IB215316]MDX8359651.1 TlyA family RNA methyltransferase [Cytobacillus sp. IB215316]
MKVKKERVDVLLVERGLAESREKAKRLIMAGLIYSNEIRLDKPGEKVDVTIHLSVKGNDHPYVSRGGLKLEKALKYFDITVEHKTMIDIGSSTGGFTDCALQNGAKLSYAIDVGYNQLAWKLRQDKRVIVMERMNFRYIKSTDLTNGMPNFASIDVSFISLRLILPVLKTLLKENSDVVALVKPQFEAGKEFVGKKGIVRDKNVHLSVLNAIVQFADEQGYDVMDVTFSPITGGDGNIEFLLHLKWSATDQKIEQFHTEVIEKVVENAHEELRKK